MAISRSFFLTSCVVLSASTQVASSQTGCCGPVTNMGWGGGGTCSSATSATVCGGTSNDGSLKFGQSVPTWCTKYTETLPPGAFVSTFCDPPPAGGLQRVDPLDTTDPCCFYNPNRVSITTFTSGTHKVCLEEPCNSMPGGPGEQ